MHPSTTKTTIKGAVLLSLFLLILFVFPSLASANIFTNPGFETGDETGWSVGYYGGSHDPLWVFGTQERSGSYCMYTRGGPGYGAWFSQNVDLSGVDNFSFWAVTWDHDVDFTVYVNADSYPLNIDTLYSYHQFTVDVSGYSGVCTINISNDGEKRDIAFDDFFGIAVVSEPLISDYSPTSDITRYYGDSDVTFSVNLSESCSVYWYRNGGLYFTDTDVDFSSVTTPSNLDILEHNITAVAVDSSNNTDSHSWTLTVQDGDVTGDIYVSNTPGRFKTVEFYSNESTFQIIPISWEIYVDELPSDTVYRLDISYANDYEGVFSPVDKSGNTFHYYNGLSIISSAGLDTYPSDPVSFGFQLLDERYYLIELVEVVSGEDRVLREGYIYCDDLCASVEPEPEPEPDPEPDPIPDPEPIPEPDPEPQNSTTNGTINSSWYGEYTAYVDGAVDSAFTPVNNAGNYIVFPVEYLTGYVDDVNSSATSTFSLVSGYQSIIAYLLAPVFEAIPDEFILAGDLYLTLQLILILMRG
jgi:hypothetical protein